MTCADNLKATIEYRGTAEQIENSREGVEFLLGLPVRYMTDDQIYNIGNLINNLESNQWSCRSDAETLAYFREIREYNPMGRWREDILQLYWRCEYPRDEWLADGYEPDEGECEALRQWLPETWVPQKSI